MPTLVPKPAPRPRVQWLALLDKFEVGHPQALRVVQVPHGLVQATTGEPPGRIVLEGAPAHVLMFNVSPVQALRQFREGRTFISDMLHGEMTLLPRGVPSEWSWNSACDRLDVIVPADVFGDGSQLDVMDRFVFRDAEIKAICHLLYRYLSSHPEPERLYVESLILQLATLLLQRHSTASAASCALPIGGLTRIQARRTLDYIESNLNRALSLAELARIADRSLHHFARMFKQTFGMAPHRYVLERRVDRARQLLRTSDAPLADISLASGFCSQSHFTSTFRRMVGATPREFQNYLRQRRPGH